MMKAGYKQTEVGVIPDDWDVKELGQIGNFSKGQGIRKDESNSGTIPCVRYGELYTRHNDYVKKFYSHISSEVAETAKKLKTGDILFAGSGETKSEIGKSVAFTKNIIAYAGGDIVILSPKYGDALFLGFLLNDVSIQKQKASRGQGDAVVHISATQLAQIKIPLPPLPEQTAIATVLSDTDKLLQAIEKKIAKKRLIKQGAMQELLRPKVGWVNQLLPEVCWYQEGPGLRNWQFTKKGMKVINVTNLVKGYLNLDKTDRHISLQEFEKMYKHFEVDDKDIVMASSGNSYSKVAVVRKQDLRLLMNTSVIRFKPINGLDYNYLLIFLKSNLFKDQIDLLITGGAQPNFGPAHLKKIKIPLPATKEEQTQISTVLTDLNNEIETLECQLTKYKQVKQGLMQNLLTGKIRLA